MQTLMLSSLYYPEKLCCHVVWPAFIRLASSPNTFRTNMADASLRSSSLAIDQDSQQLLKTSYALRAQLARPVSRVEAAQDSNKQQDGKQVPTTSSKGTKGGPVSGNATRDWLATEVRKDVDELKQAVDAAATRRETQAFELERGALQAQLADLRRKLSAAEERNVQLERMLPKDGTFDHMRKEIESLDKECDAYVDMLDREEAKRRGAQEAIRSAIGHLDEIEQEFDRIKVILGSDPSDPSTTAPATSGQQPSTGQAAGRGAAQRKQRFSLFRRRGADGRDSGAAADGAAGPSGQDDIHATAHADSAAAGGGGICGCFGPRRRRAPPLTQQQRQAAAQVQEALIGTAGTWRGLGQPGQQDGSAPTANGAVHTASGAVHTANGMPSGISAGPGTGATAAAASDHAAMRAGAGAAPGTPYTQAHAVPGESARAATGNGNEMGARPATAQAGSSGVAVGVTMVPQLPHLPAASGAGYVNLGQASNAGGSAAAAPAAASSASAGPSQLHSQQQPAPTYAALSIPAGASRPASRPVPAAAAAATSAHMGQRAAQPTPVAPAAPIYRQRFRM